MNKKAFTLIEVLISITLLVIIVLFLYQVLDITTKSNKFFSSKLLIQTDKIRLKDIFVMDIMHSGSNMIENLTENRDKNTILSLKSTNTYHNNSYNNITYLLSKENNLIRIENKRRFNKDKVDYDFLDQAYIDILTTNIDKFKVAYKHEKYSIYIKFKDETDMMFVVKSMR